MGESAVTRVRSSALLVLLDLGESSQRSAAVDLVTRLQADGEGRVDRLDRFDRTREGRGSRSRRSDSPRRRRRRQHLRSRSTEVRGPPKRRRIDRSDAEDGEEVVYDAAGGGGVACLGNQVEKSRKTVRRDETLESLSSTARQRAADVSACGARSRSTSSRTLRSNSARFTCTCSRGGAEGLRARRRRAGRVAGRGREASPPAAWERRAGEPIEVALDEPRDTRAAARRKTLGTRDHRIVDAERELRHVRTIRRSAHVRKSAALAVRIRARAPQPSGQLRVSPVAKPSWKRVAKPRWPG